MCIKLSILFISSLCLGHKIRVSRRFLEIRSSPQGIFFGYWLFELLSSRYAFVYMLVTFSPQDCIMIILPYPNNCIFRNIWQSGPFLALIFWLPSTQWMCDMYNMQSWQVHTCKHYDFTIYVKSNWESIKSRIQKYLLWKLCMWIHRAILLQRGISNNSLLLMLIWREKSFSLEKKHTSSIKGRLLQ